MFVIFGWGKQEVTSYGPVHYHTCPKCNNSEYWQLQKISHYFTLFFIPIYAHNRGYWYYCPICNNGIALDLDVVKYYMAIAEANTAYINKAISDDELSARTAVANSAIDEIERLKNLKYLKESKDFKAVVSRKTDEELAFIGNDRPDKYSPPFLIAVEQEMKQRNLLREGKADAGQDMNDTNKRLIG